MLCGSIPKEMSFRNRSVRIGFLEIPVSAGKCDLSNSHLVSGDSRRRETPKLPYAFIQKYCIHCMRLFTKHDLCPTLATAEVFLELDEQEL